MGRKIEYEEALSHKSNFGPSDIWAPVNVVPMARAMPAIP